jgi:hypothetical protein
MSQWCSIHLVPVLQRHSFAFATLAGLLLRLINGVLVELRPGGLELTSIANVGFSRLPLPTQNEINATRIAGAASG